MGERYYIQRRAQDRLWEPNDWQIQTENKKRKFEVDEKEDIATNTEMARIVMELAEMSLEEENPLDHVVTEVCTRIGNMSLVLVLLLLLFIYTRAAPTQYILILAYLRNSRNSRTQETQELKKLWELMRRFQCKVG